MVVCAVKLCRNYTGKNIKSPEGISFHRFPTDPDQRQEWIDAICRESSWEPGTHCRVCSVHFDNSDFKISETGRRILLKDAVPCKNLYREERSDVDSSMVRRIKRPRLVAKRSSSSSAEQLQACRACLITDTPLLQITDDVANTFFEAVGSTVSSADGLPQSLCNICLNMLYKYAEFKFRCELAQSLLGEAREKGDEITTAYIRSIDRHFHNLALNLSIKQLPSINLTEIDVKQEQIDLLLDEGSNHDVTNDNYDIFDDNREEVDEIKAENDETMSETVFDVETQDIDSKNEVFIEVDADKILEKDTKSKRRKSELKRKHKKLKREIVKEKVRVKDVKAKIVKEDIRNTKARKNDEDYELFATEYDVDIVFLTMEEQIAEVQARKDSDNYKNSRFKCEECFKGFTAESAFNNHKAKHDPAIGKYVCEPCGFRFPKRYKMLHHLSHHKMNFICKLCNHVSKLPSKAKEHFKWHNGVKYPCLYCDKSFVKRTSQFNHMRNRHGSACCDICQQIFSGKRGLSAHMIKAHKEAVKSRCDSCGTQFHTEEAMARHLETLPEMICLPDCKPCPECGDNFNTEEELNAHSKQNHWREINCDKCNANFENEKLYRMHRIIHKEFRERRARSEGRVAVRGKRHAPGGIHRRMCEMCGLTWRSLAALRYHQRVHTGEKPFQCPVCHKCFRIQDSLQIHMNTHTGARPFKCPHCPKAFKSRTQNHKHQLVHTKVRRHRCDLCDKTFQTSTCVKTHIRSVHMKLPAPPRAPRRPHDVRPEQHKYIPMPVT